MIYSTVSCCCLCRPTGASNLMRFLCFLTKVMTFSRKFYTVTFDIAIGNNILIFYGKLKGPSSCYENILKIINTSLITLIVCYF